MKLLRGFRTGPSAETESWSVEIQIHPSDIRRRVRYLFLSRVQVTLVCIVALVYILFLALGAALAPGVVGAWLNDQEYTSLAAERASQGQLLQAHLEALGQLEEKSDGLYLGLHKLFLAYGLPHGRPESPQGPLFAAENVPESVYASAVQEGNRRSVRIRQRLSLLETSLTTVRAFERDHQDRVRLTPSICPLSNDFVVTSSFRRRRSPFTRELDFHPGLDLAAPSGTPIRATADGVVAFAGQFSAGRSPAWWRFGNLVILRHDDLFVTIYGHCQDVLVKAGQTVRRGDEVATVGNTGWSPSPHLHYEVRRNTGSDYVPVDPTIHILDRRWQNDERLLMGKPLIPTPGSWEPLPPGILR
ncbi:MAG TPA: M23 family metallopeptidase [Thermoanaerobaculia bacterium]|nr:M23 family metallopeptidase [Thermoanaerobaculia bacterium]